jgi:acetyl esterase/lipase
MRSKMVLAITSIALLSGSQLLLFLSAQTVVRQLGGNFPPEQGFTVTSNVTYTTGDQGPLKADVYIPTGAGPFPGIVFIHGGGWKNGNRHQMIRLIQALAEDGYVGFTIDYDVDPVHFPASFHESISAVKFFREHAAEYRLDPSRVAVAGSSAGGELAALVALDPEGATFDNAPTAEQGKSGASARVQAAVILNGVLDLTSQDESLSTAVADYLGGPCSSRQRDCKDASPLFHVHAGAPPFYVGHGTADQTVPFAEAVEFTNQLKNASVPVEFFKAEGGRHTFWADPRFYAENLEGIRKFLGVHLRGEAQGKLSK